MKKVIVILFAIFQMLNIYAVTSGNLDFDIHWNVITPANTTITVLPYSGSGTLPQDQENNYLKTIIPADNSTMINVCLVRYRTNEKGTHKIRFYATPMTSTLTSAEHPYTLYITYGNGFPIGLSVDPEESENYEDIVFSVIGIGQTTANIHLDATITDLDNMAPGEYESTVTIVRITE